ncbi:xaa-Pro aminopeptidase 3-like [Wyeomyia smithii]|uniref:xaa-Pro aminopeptidase 3-like n=1 Tax=Wyeomyia smithii TaxID=174621 RepID=UPI0024680A3F|nr:xaa-Pro aminopeptidase 3-like [Wyeomyia smithii]XP_055533428.1 xaa-Pro aminopeptidase 3-like [Wyeomyia smithii]XP_055533441.1 xaa-Pro aminopeptidase 3-like [Wyeomyia smithii]XP_055533449.1 xaa-Pro aminopeptidase 3-like [Wyeomyia smithii]XP_055533457.1 xaa-Pro aminopeptidase 3-like [Wyeomyia smithii]
MNLVRVYQRFRPVQLQNLQFFNRCSHFNRHCSSNAVPRNLPKAVSQRAWERSQEAGTVSYGQPMPATHPHLLQDGDLLPGIRLAEIKARRRALLELTRNYAAANLSRDAKEHLIIIPSASKKYMSDKIPYVFRQNSDFLYLSGCLEPDSVLTLELDGAGNEHCVLYVRPKDSHAELWDGPRTGVELAPEVFGVDRAANVIDLKANLTQYTFAHPSGTIWFDEKACNLDDVRRIVADVGKQNTVRSPAGLVHKLRVIKSPAEVELMRKTCQIASEGINRTMGGSQPGQSEHQLFAKVDFYCRMAGASYLAYPPVVAGGSNATVIHYINNTQIVRDGEMVLMDAGCEYGGYTSDITRTWPINGKFSEPQRMLYQVLQQVQKELLVCLQNKGGETLDQLFDTMCLKIGKYLQEVGLIARSLKGLDLARAAYKFCPHHVSHYLGMDVHDTPQISRSVPLAAGMVCTVEPGIYINRQRKDVPEEFRGLGLRIEDDVLICPDGKIEVLTESCVKDLHQIEALVGSHDC